MAMSIKQVVLGTLTDVLDDGGSEWPEPITDGRFTRIVGARGPKEQHHCGLSR